MAPLPNDTDFDDEEDEAAEDEENLGENEDDEEDENDEDEDEGVRGNYQTLSTENIILDEGQRPEALVKVFGYITTSTPTFISTLRAAVGIQSISTWPKARIECIRMIQFAQEKLKELGFDLELRKIGSKPLVGDEEAVALPPVILGVRGNDPQKKTVLIYGHLDVLPAERADGWSCEPFYLTEEGNCLYGRGASDDKGPVLGWFHAIEAFIKSGIRLPVNVKIMLESMEECGSPGLSSLIEQTKETFLSDVDVIVMSDNYWLGKTKPCVTYGLRGLCYFFMEVECGSRDLHSGVYGGVVREAMPDLIYLLNELVAPDGSILIPGIMDNVCPILPEEKALYKDIDFDLEEFQADGGFKGLRFEDKKLTLMNRWRFPSLTIHGIQGAFDKSGAGVVIPRKVIGKFSLRLVPNQDPDVVCEMVKTYIKGKWEERGSPNKMLIYMADEGTKPWCANPFHPSFKAARQAIGWVYGKMPDMIREGGSVDNLLAFQKATGKNIVLLPMGASDDHAHAVNEKINKENYIEGTKVFAAFLHEIGRIENKEDFNA